MQHSPLLNLITKQNLGGLPEEEFLKHVTRHHPYFTPAQFYLLQQLKESDAAYPLQTTKTAVLFNNPFWLQFQLQQPADIIVATPEIITTILPEENTDNDDDKAVITQPHPAVEEPVPAATFEPAATAAETEKLPLTDEQLMLAENADNNDDDAVMEEITPIKITIPNLEAGKFDDNTPAFEPMHLVDYFASQGIKLSDEVQTADKLGKQLKSFTEWLKTMKKIHVPDTEANAGISDIAVQALAAKSNKEGEIVTEAMAEVLLQQGKAGKAIEVYQKLSLLNPSKSAFFAAKIEQLKGT
ncbi:hypothetical protein [Ferruginibacter sp. SUN106]|uniref:hypothetical protein n=1 Tax=Ferruginibacter sp. SUN106 TaxID=2978348 RepID=UPI003D361CED